MPYPAKILFDIIEDMVQILLMLKVFSPRILRLKICYVVLLPALNPICFCSNNLFNLDFGRVQDFFQHDFYLHG